MNRAQQYINALFDRVPIWEFPVESRNSFDSLKQRFSETSDVYAELRQLFRVNNFGDIAISLMWIAGTVDQDPTRLDPTAEDESMFTANLRTALLGETAVAPSTSAPGDAFSSGAEMFGGAVEDTPSPTEHDATFQTKDFGFGVQEAGSSSVPTSFSMTSGNITTDVAGFSSFLEKFLESVQSGSDDRMELLQGLEASSQFVVSSDQPDEFKQFCKYLIEFLQYIVANQFLDDVRVMNLVTNIQEQFAQWAQASPSDRTGLLDNGIEILRDFKSMFE